MNDKKQTKFLPSQDGMNIENQNTNIYEGMPLPDWLQQPAAEKQWSEPAAHRQGEQAPIPDWVLTPVTF